MSMRISKDNHGIQIPTRYNIKQRNDENIDENNSLRTKEDDFIRLELSENALELYQRQVTRMGSNGRKANEESTTLGKILTIARRISDGDIVPPRDERKLMEYSSKLYQFAKSAGSLRKKEDRIKYDSLFECEDKVDMRNMISDLDQEIPMNE